MIRSISYFFRSYRPNEFAGSVTPKMLSKQMSIHSPVARTMANHRRALSVRSKTSNNTNKNKRYVAKARGQRLHYTDLFKILYKMYLDTDTFKILSKKVS